MYPQCWSSNINKSIYISALHFFSLFLIHLCWHTLPYIINNAPTMLILQRKSIYICAIRFFLRHPEFTWVRSPPQRCDQSGTMLIRDVSPSWFVGCVTWCVHRSAVANEGCQLSPVQTPKLVCLAFSALAASDGCQCTSSVVGFFSRWWGRGVVGWLCGWWVHGQCRMHPVPCIVDRAGWWQRWSTLAPIDDRFVTVLAVGLQASVRSQTAADNDWQICWQVKTGTNCSYFYLAMFFMLFTMSCFAVCRK